MFNDFTWVSLRCNKKNKTVDYLFPSLVVYGVDNRGICNGPL